MIERAPSDAGQPFVAVGEILWDFLPDGPRLGGAPFNVVAHAARLGRASIIVSAVGRDALGDRAREEAARLGVDTAWLATTDEAPTGIVEVALEGWGAPIFRIALPAAYLDAPFDERQVTRLVATKPAAVIFGTLAQSAPAVHRLTERLVTSCPDALAMYDANLRDGMWDSALVRSLLGLASVIKLNAAEFDTVVDVLGLRRVGLAASLFEIARRTRARVVCVTDGADRATLLADGELVTGRPPVVRAVDAVGAGDALAAGLLDGLRAGRPLDVILRRALALGALVASRTGAVPAWDPGELEAMVAVTPVPSRMPVTV